MSTLNFIVILFISYYVYSLAKKQTNSIIKLNKRELEQKIKIDRWDREYTLYREFQEEFHAYCMGVLSHGNADHDRG